jgi:HlyD family secretion protein
MAKPHSTRIAGAGSSQLAARGAGGGVIPAADAGDAAAPLLLEYESPSATLLALPIPFRSRFVIWLIASMFAAIMVVAFTLPIDRIVVASGKVIPTEQNVVMQPLETSIVRSIDVEEGQIVHKGDILARLDPTFAASDAASAEQQAQSLQAEVDRLRAELDGRTYLSDGNAAGQLQAMMYTQRHAEFSFKLENYRQKIDSLQAKLNQANSDITSYTERLKVATVVEDKRRELERLQVGSQLNTLAAIDSRVEMGRSLEAARQTALGAKQDLAAEISERDGYVQSWRNDAGQQLADQDRKLADMLDEVNKNKLRRELVVLRADRDAIVLSIAPVSVGSVLQPADQFFTLVPIDSPLEIEAVVDGRDTGFVHLGDPVTIKFQTFPYFVYGIARGQVRVISPDSFHRPLEDLDQITKGTGTTPGTSNQASSRAEAAAGIFFYRARITIDQILLHDLPPGFRLTPGMPVQADIKVGRRTVVQYLLSRVIPATTEGMHEP